MQFARVQWDGSYKVNAIFTHYWDVPVNQYSGRGYHHDEILTNARFGIRVGYTCDPRNGNCATAEWFVSRVWFYNAWAAGFSIEGWNNLDWNLRHCIFYNCSMATTNWWGSGNFHVSESGFYHCGVVIQLANCLYYSIRDNFVYNTTRMLWTQYYGCRTQFLFVRNTFIAPDANPTAMIWNSEDTSITFIDNTVVYNNRSFNSTIVASASGYFTKAFFYSVGNTFGFAGDMNHTVGSIDPNFNIEKKVEFDNVVKNASDVKWDFPVHPGFQRLTKSPIIYANVSHCLNPQAKICHGYLQSLIDKASTMRGQRPIIYFATRVYGTNETLVVPPNSDIQFVGKDMSADYFPTSSAIVWQNPQAGYIFTVQGPTKVTFKSLTMTGYTFGSGILFVNVDQPGSRIIGEQVDFGGSVTHNFLVDNIDWMHIEMHANYAINSVRSTGTVMRGGPCSAADKGTSRFAIFSGASAGSSGQSLYEIYNGGKMLVESIWWEQGSVWVRLNSSHSGTIQLINLNTWANNETITLKGFPGKFSIMNAQVYGNINITDVKSTTNVLLLQVSRNNDTKLREVPFAQQNFNPGKVAFIQNWYNDVAYADGHYAPPDIGTAKPTDTAWHRDMVKSLFVCSPA